MVTAWDSCWGGSILPCKVAAAGDEGQLVCAAGAAAIVSSNRFLLGVLQRVDAKRIVMASCMDMCSVLQNAL